jgi:hypothetical protein
MPYWPDAAPPCGVAASLTTFIPENIIAGLSGLLNHNLMTRFFAYTALILGCTSVVNAQTIAVTSDAGTGTSGSTYAISTTDPYFAQFGVTGALAGPTLLNVGGSGLSVTPITEFGDTTPEQTQFTSGASVSYTNGTSPTNSNTTVTNTTNLTQRLTGIAGAVSVQTGFTGNNDTAQRSGQGLEFIITFDQAFSSGSLVFVLNTYSATSTTTYTLDDPVAGDQSVSADDPTPPPAYANDDFLQQIQLTNVAAGDTLTVSDLETAGEGSPYDDISVTGFALTSVTVPEPSTYAMLFGGLGMLVLVSRFRRKLSV